LSFPSCSQARSDPSSSLATRFIGADRVFARLAANVDDNPALDVRIFTNIKRPRRDVRADSELVREFAEKFRRHTMVGAEASASDVRHSRALIVARSAIVPARKVRDR
jgi:hypothetical protein